VQYSDLKKFGTYVTACLPKYIQQAAVTKEAELELHVHPNGIVPVISFLKDHQVSFIIDY
jgi:NADH dehydrogenase (ubiquinone) Fe-S protein 3